VLGRFSGFLRSVIKSGPILSASSKTDPNWPARRDQIAHAVSQALGISPDRVDPLKVRVSVERGRRRTEVKT